MAFTIALTAFFIIGWVAAAILGTQAYFKGELTKPIHDRNWNSQGFEQFAAVVAGETSDYNNRVPGFNADAYISKQISS